MTTRSPGTATPVRRWPVGGSFHLRRTLSGLTVWGASPWIRLDGEGGWVASRTEHGPATVRIWRHGEEVAAEAWGPGAELLLEQVPRIVGLHDDPEALVTDHPLVRELHRRRPGVRIGTLDQVFPTLVATVLAQKVTGRESAAATRRMAWWWGEPAPGPHDRLRLIPAAQELKLRSYAEFHQLGVERRRAMVVLEVARRAKRLEACVGMEPVAAAQRLQVLPGIGPWTAGVVLGQALGDPDAVPVGDYHLPNVVAWNLAREPRATDDRMLELLGPFAGQRGRVARLLKTSGEAPPKWGPRFEGGDIRGM